MTPLPSGGIGVPATSTIAAVDPSSIMTIIVVILAVAVFVAALAYLDRRHA